MAGATGIVHYTNPIVGQLLGGQWGEDINMQERGGIGGAGVNVPGAQFAAARVQYLPVETTNYLLDKVLRASYPNGAMTSITLEVGDDELGIKSTAWNVHEAELTMEAEAALQANLLLHLLSGKHTREAGAGSHAACAGTTFEWYRGHAKVGTANAGLRRVSFTVRNNLVPFWSLNDVAAASARFPEYGNKGNEIVRIAAVYLVDPDENLSLDEMQAIGTLVGTCINDAAVAQTITLTATTPQIHSWSTAPAAHDALKTYDVALGLNPNSGAFTIAAA